MKGKILAVVVLVLVGLGLLVNGQMARASIDPILVVDDVFAGINSGNVDRAVAAFAEDATVENKVRSETYRGVSEIRQMLQGMQRQGRRFDIVLVERDGDMITAKVEVSDHGKVWGTETIEAVVKDGKLQTFTVKAFRLELWRITH